LIIQASDAVSSQFGVWRDPDNQKMEEQPIIEVPLDCLSVGDSPRIFGENPEHVQALAAVEAQLPPIIVHRPTMRVIDGMHRMRVAELRGRERIAVRFFDGDDADAFVLAVKANISHGLPLSLADRKSAAARVVASHPQWSDRMIASVTGVSAWAITEMRAKQTEAAWNGSRIGRDGRVRPVDGSHGRRIAWELMTDNPSLSLRQVARAAGISPETVRDVRNRLRRGENPVPGNERKRRASREPASREPNSERRRLAPGRNIAPGQAPIRDRAAVVGRLKADPALRLTETGRSLLILLQAHALSPMEWKNISDNVPAHCSAIVARLAKDCAQMWAELAQRVEEKSCDLP
jgi:ParB-like chromosome segregation protein Spo0J